MLTTAELLAAANAAQNIPSNYRLARALDVPEKTVQRWNTGRGCPDDEYAVALAKLAGLDAGEVVAAIRAERASEGPMRDFWASVAERLHRAGAVAAAVLLVVGDFGSANDPAPRPRLPAPAVHLVRARAA